MNSGNWFSLHVTWEWSVSVMGGVINVESVDRIVMGDGSGLGPALASDWSVYHAHGL